MNQEIGLCDMENDSISRSMQNEEQAFAKTKENLVVVEERIKNHYIVALEDGTKPLVFMTPVTVSKTLRKINLLSNCENANEFHNTYCSMTVGENLEMLTVINKLG